jgi:hypothetical protein
VPAYINVLHPLLYSMQVGVCRSLRFGQMNIKVPVKINLLNSKKIIKKYEKNAKKYYLLNFAYRCT